MTIFGVGLWEIALWLVGTVGVGGAIVLFFLAPQVFGVIARAVIKAFAFVLSYRIGCALVAGLLAAFIADWHRHSIDDAEFAQRTALFEHAQKQRDERIATETRDAVWTEIADATAANVVIDQDVKDFTDAPPLPPPTTGDPYAISPADRLRLCRIAGKTQCEPTSRKGVPATRRPTASTRDRKLPKAVRSGAG